MSDQRQASRGCFSRRSLLCDGVRLAGAAALVTASGTGAMAQPKISQKAVAYQDHPDGEKRCDRCTHFQAPSACNVVDGPIDPQGSCKLFVPGRQTG